MDMLLEFLKQETAKWKILVQEMEREWEMCPEGRLFLRTQGETTIPYCRFREEQKGKGVFVRKSLGKEDSVILRSFFRKEELRRELPRLRRNLALLETTVRKWSRKEEKKSLYERYYKRRGMVAPWQEHGLYKEKETVVEAWLCKKGTVFANGQWDRNGGDTGESVQWHPESLRHVTAGGERRRSKSEVVLDEILRNLGLAYAYERPLYIGDRRYLPDYTILRPSDLQVFFLEHYGLTETDEAGTMRSWELQQYALRNEEKRRAYQRAGIVPWKNLLYTYDLPDGTLDVQGIRKALELFLEL